DGYIAKPDDDLSFLDIVQAEGEDYGYHQFVDSIDTVIIGRKTHEWVLNQVGSTPHPSKVCYVITRAERPSEGNTHFYSGNLETLVATLKGKEGKDIYCDGGAEVVNTLLRANLLDEIILSVIPVMVGEGIRLFQDGRPEQNLHLVSSQAFASGLVQLHYRIG
ncbi:MAG: dihydrofolate reductase family protein, partial [Bacteroidia bacterium]|nr:dihydrofolate reductase family protein [Bacteroidia bacterium]